MKNLNNTTLTVTAIIVAGHIIRVLQLPGLAHLRQKTQHQKKTRQVTDYFRHHYSKPV